MMSEIFQSLRLKSPSLLVSLERTPHRNLSGDFLHESFADLVVTAVLVNDAPDDAFPEENVFFYRKLRTLAAGGLGEREGKLLGLHISQGDFLLLGFHIFQIGIIGEDALRLFCQRFRILPSLAFVPVTRICIFALCPSA